MANRVVMPKLTDTMEEGVLRRWYKKEGESIESGDPIAEVETDKAIMDLEAFASGVVKKILVAEGAVVPSGNLIAIIAREDEAIDVLLEEAREKKAGDPVGERSVPQAFGNPVSALKETSAASPKDIEAQRGGTTPVEPRSSPTRLEQPLSMLRKTIARRMAKSKGPVPHFYVTSEMAMENLLVFKEARRAAGLKLTMTEIFLKATAMTLRAFPCYRSSYQGDSVQIAEGIDLGFAVGIPDGVITPVIRDCDHKSLAAIAEETRDKIQRALAMRLDPSEYTGAVFSISNLGMYAVESFSAIITPPESGVLAIGAIMEKPVAQNGVVTIGKTVKVTLSTDHRVADGILAAQFLAALNEILQNPKQLEG